jgi:hypothetical protein
MRGIDDQDKTHHSLSQLNVDYIAVNTQSHLGVFPASPGKTDVRHNKLDKNSQRFPPSHYHGKLFQTFLFQSSVRPQQAASLPTYGRHHAIAAARSQWCSNQKDWKRTTEARWYYEPCGVKHLDRLWPEQGKENSETSVMCRSSDLYSNSVTNTTSSERFIHEVNLYVQELLLPRVLATFPYEYEHTYRPIYRTAALDEEEERRAGFHTGHVIVHNQPVHQHMDGGDSGFCITFCTGSFDGGYVVFPDLNLVFLYRPGDILIFRSRALYHGVTTWTPRGNIDDLGVIPGRTAHVLYTKSATVNFAKHRGSGWAHMTGVGKEPLRARAQNAEEFKTEHDGLFRQVRRRGHACLNEKRSGLEIPLSRYTRSQLDQIAIKLAKKKARAS